jgi:phospholipase/lecithinase/hemolysin
MRFMKSWALASITALLLAACGGGDPDVPGSGSPSGAPTAKGSFTSLVSFGDSLSDVGTYAPATSLAGNGTAPYIGGQFTTNSATSTVWVQNLAASLGLVVTPAEVGYGTNSVKCPIPGPDPVHPICTAYGQAGARVTDPNGSGHSGGALTVPVVTQIANHLSRFSTFKDSDLIVVWAGNNDVFAQLDTFAAAAQQIQAAAAAGSITADQANTQLFAAQTAAQAAIKTAALELAVDINTQILAKGGKYVAVINLPDIGDTPFGQSLPADLRPVLTDLSRLFNLWLNEGLTGRPVQIVDIYTIYKTLLANPAQYGFVNSTTPACDPAKISVITSGQITDGSSLFCNSTVGAPYYGLATGADPATWLFADGVHPTTGGHKALSDAIAAQLHAFGWI